MITTTNMKSLSLLVQKLQPRLTKGKFFQKYIKSQGRGQKVKIFVTDRQTDGHFWCKQYEEYLPVI